MINKEWIAALARLTADGSIGDYAAVAGALGAMTPEESRLPVLKAAILRNYTIDPLIPVLKGEIALSGFYPELYLGGYDTIAQDVLDPAGAVYAFQPDFVILAQWLETLAPDFMNRFAALVPDKADQELERILSRIGDMISALRRNTGAPVLINNFPLPAHAALGILDAQSEACQTHAVLQLNLKLLQLARQWTDIYLVDYMSMMARIGSLQGVDERYWHMGRAPLSRHALIAFGREYGKFFRALRGKSRKCLVLDCDNTLWGGVLGEEGMSGIRIGAAYPGSCYLALQREILNLRDRGVILALCSKNNEADVLEVLRTHTDMLLRESHFAFWQINWDDKVTNLIRIAQELNIGLDSLVFVDDSPFECGMVREQLPQVAVLCLDSDPSTFRNRLAGTGFFDTLTLSDEDRRRNQMYRDNTQRKQLLESSGSLEEYLANLGMAAEIGPADESHIGRVSQLTQKTNQFNLTTKRYTEDDIRAFVQDPDADVFYLRLRDRVAEMGLVAAAIVRYDGQEARIDTFLMSCRAIGRGVEEALLAHILNAAGDRGCKQAQGRYVASLKNSQVADFYRRRGFSCVRDNQNESEWELPLDRVFPSPYWIRIESALDKECCHANQ